MTWNYILYYTIQFLRACVAYLGLKVVRCAIISLPVMGLILLLRITVLKRSDFGRCAIWGLLLFLPFLGKLKVYYETRLGVRLFLWQNNLCLKYSIVDGIYLTGVTVALMLMYRQHRKLHRMIADMDQLRKGVYLSDMSVSPFTFGLLRPKIIIPKLLYREFSLEELRIVLQHEQTHIIMGHLWMLRIWELLQCIFWINPLFAVGLKYFKEDIEWLCDRICIQRYGQDAIRYGEVLLKSTAMLSARVCKSNRYAAFGGEGNYDRLKKRVLHIGESKQYDPKRVRAFACFLAVLSVLLFVGIYIISYPVYTAFDDIAVYDMTGTKCLLQDSEALREAIHISEGTVYVNKMAINCLLDDVVTDRPDCFFVYFGGYYKIPGIGGGGNGVFCWPEDFEGDIEIPYQESDDIWTLMFRYL